MKHSELKQLIREELQKILSEEPSSEFTPQNFRPGETVLHMGQRFTVVSDDGNIGVRVKTDSGKVKMINRKNLKKVVNESPYPLIPKKMLLADILEINDIPDEEFTPQTKSAAVNFIRNGRPSETYLERIVNILKDYGVDTSEIETPPTATTNKFNPSDGLNPRDYGFKLD